MGFLCPGLRGPAPYSSDDGNELKRRTEDDRYDSPTCIESLLEERGRKGLAESESGCRDIVDSLLRQLSYGPRDENSTECRDSSTDKRQDKR